MKRIVRINLIACLVMLTIFLACGASTVFAQENQADIQAAEGESEDDIKKIQKKEAQTEGEIKEKEEDIKEAEQKLEEKKKIEKEAELKEQAAVIAKQKLEVVKKEAQITDDPKALTEAKALTKEVKKLEEEAAISKEKLKVAEEEEKLAQTQILANETAIEDLKKKLEYLKREKSLKRSFIEKILMSLPVIVISLVFFILLKFGVKKLEAAVTKKDAIYEDDATQRIKTLSRLFHWLGGFVLFSVTIYMILENFGFSLAPLIAGAGIVGLAFGFGGQYLIRDLINGLFIIIEGQYNINDVVKIGEHGGLVEGINLRITTLRDLAGRVIFIPNGEIKTVINFTREYAQALLNVGVAYKENVDQVMDVIKKVGSEMREDSYFGKLILADLEMLGVDNFADSQVTIKFRIKTLPIKQWEVSREFRRRLKNRFDELGIEIPFPHRTLYWGTGNDNDWMKELLNRGK